LPAEKVNLLVRRAGGAGEQGEKDFIWTIYLKLVLIQESFRDSTP
jgi:hypothetical protein